MAPCPVDSLQAIGYPRRLGKATMPRGPVKTRRRRVCAAVVKGFKSDDHERQRTYAEPPSEFPRPGNRMSSFSCWMMTSGRMRIRSVCSVLEVMRLVKKRLMIVRPVQVHQPFADAGEDV